MNPVTTHTSFSKVIKIEIQKIILIKNIKKIKINFRIKND